VLGIERREDGHLARERLIVSERQVSQRPPLDQPDQVGVPQVAALRGLVERGERALEVGFLQQGATPCHSRVLRGGDRGRGEKPRAGERGERRAESYGRCHRQGWHRTAPGHGRAMHPSPPGAAPP
jgi:hypothetical protein